MLWRTLTFLWLALWLAPNGVAEPLHLQFWHSMSGEKGGLLKNIVEQFNALPENAGQIRVEMQFVGTYEEGLNKVRTALLAHRLPNIAQITDIGTQVMIDTGAVAPLQHFITGDSSFPNRELLPQLRRYYEVNGQLYSLPFATSNPIIYYNADAFAKAGLHHGPTTFTELTAYAAKLTDRKARTTGITWPLHSWFFEQLLSEQGVPLVNNDNGRHGRATEINLTAPAALDVIHLWAGMVKAGTFANVGRGWDPAEQNFLAGRSMMLITSTSDVFEILRKAPFRVGTAPLPKKDPGIAGGTIVGGNSLWILKRDPAEEKASYAFIKFMASKSVQRKWHTNTGYFPIRSDVIAELTREGFYRKYPAALTAIEQMRASPEIPATQGALLGVFPEAREHIDSAIEQILTDSSAPLTALTKAKEETQAAMKRYNRGRDAAQH